LDEFLQDLDEDVEAMQSTIYLLQNELQKTKASLQNTNDTDNKKTNPKVNGITKDDVITTETHSISKTEISTNVVEPTHDNKSSKQNIPKDCKCNLQKVKKIRPIKAEVSDLSGKTHKVHKSKLKSDKIKSEEKRIKSEKRTLNKDEVILKKSKYDGSKITEIKNPIAAINGLPNGSQT